MQPNRSKRLGGYFDKAVIDKRLGELRRFVDDPALWNDQARAQSILKEKSTLEDKLQKLEKFESDFAYLSETLELMKTDESMSSMYDEIEAELKTLDANLDDYKMNLLLSDPADANDCYLEVHAGAGGTEAQDWTEMLLRMYSRWCANQDRGVEFIDETAGEEAGIKSATIKISGTNSYGWLKMESGVHRLVRISPFDSNARRHTSFAAVSVYPVVDENIDVAINPSDLRIDTYRSSGAGGQHVNKTDSAVRITHIPTRIVVQSQNQRSQHQNREAAMNMLRARLYQLELEKQVQKKQQMDESKLDNAWGSQIRSYVAQPYQMVKDLRTGAEIPNFQYVLDGNIDKFLKASLMQFKSKN